MRGEVTCAQSQRDARAVLESGGLYGAVQTGSGAHEAPAAKENAAVILPILLLLMTEGADKFLLFALLYILM